MGRFRTGQLESDLGFDRIRPRFRESDVGFAETEVGFGETEVGFDVGKIEFSDKFCTLEPISSYEVDGTCVPHTKHEVRHTQSS